MFLAREDREICIYGPSHVTNGCVFAYVITRTPELCTVSSEHVIYVDDSAAAKQAFTSHHQAQRVDGPVERRMLPVQSAKGACQGRRIARFTSWMVTSMLQHDTGEERMWRLGHTPRGESAATTDHKDGDNGRWAQDVTHGCGQEVCRFRGMSTRHGDECTECSMLSDVARWVGHDAERALE